MFIFFAGFCSFCVDNRSSLLDSFPIENGSGKDDTDAWPSFGSRTAHSASVIAPPTFGPVIRMPVERDSEVYNMNHPRRGTAIIFNHMYFDQRLGLKQRNGTNVDRDSLKSVLKGLDFEVRVYNDLHFKVC